MRLTSSTLGTPAVTATAQASHAACAGSRAGEQRRDLPEAGVEVGRVDDVVVAELGRLLRELGRGRSVVDRLTVDLELEPPVRADEPRAFALQPERHDPDAPRRDRPPL